MVSWKYETYWTPHKSQVESDELKELVRLCARSVSVLHRTSLCRVLKLPFPTDVDGVALDGRITSDIGYGSL